MVMLRGQSQCAVPISISVVDMRALFDGPFDKSHVAIIGCGYEWCDLVLTPRVYGRSSFYQNFGDIVALAPAHSRETSVKTTTVRWKSLGSLEKQKTEDSDAPIVNSQRQGRVSVLILL